MHVCRIACVVALAMSGLSAPVAAGTEAQHDLCHANTTAGLTAVVPGKSIGSLQIGMSEADAQSILSGATRVPDKASGWVTYFYGQPPVPDSRVIVDPSGHVAYAESVAYGCQTSEGIRGVMSDEQQVREAYGTPSVLVTPGTSAETWLFNDRGILMFMMKGAASRVVTWIAVFAPHEYCKLPHSNCNKYKPTP